MLQVEDIAGLDLGAGRQGMDFLPVGRFACVVVKNKRHHAPLGEKRGRGRFRDGLLELPVLAAGKLQARGDRGVLINDVELPALNRLGLLGGFDFTQPDFRGGQLAQQSAASIYFTK